MLLNRDQNLTAILNASAEVLDVPDHVYEDAILKYEDVAQHLSAHDSDLLAHDPQIYVQGSFRLGTVVQPLVGEDEYDVDLVCRLNIVKEAITQEELKSKIGNRLKARQDLAKILEESRRCWTLDYPNQTDMPGFHMDVLPSIPNTIRVPNGILLTDKELRLWQKSNPVAYSDWFKSRMEVVFRERRIALADATASNVEDIPDWQVKTPLQRCVQILKRHRDVHFQDRPDEKPISIIITTLAAHAYANEEDTFAALQGIVERMPNFIERRGDLWWVPNPVEPDENFADKWQQYPERRDAFAAWLGKVRKDIINASEARDMADGVVLLSDSLGSQTMSRVAAKLGVQSPQFLPATVSKALVVPELGDTSHVLSPTVRFHMPPVLPYRVSITGSVHLKEHGKRLWALADRPVSKGLSLKFTASTNYRQAHTIRWQVVNTGEEAKRANQPRGDFYDSDSVGGNYRWESTAYRGTHWVEAFVLDALGNCVARSGRRLVKIR